MKSKKDLIIGQSHLMDKNHDKVNVLSEIILCTSAIQHKIEKFAKMIVDVENEGSLPNIQSKHTNFASRTRRKGKISTEQMFDSDGKFRDDSLNELANMMISIQADSRKQPWKSYFKLMLNMPESSFIAGLYNFILIICISTYIPVLGNRMQVLF